MTAPAANHSVPLIPSDKRLFRQVRGEERYIKNGVLTSLAFRPLPKDHGELSVDVEPLTSAQQCYEAFKANGGDTVGVWAVTTQECKNVGLDSYLKPKTTPPLNLSHGYVDFTVVAKEKEERKKGARLAEYAMARGRLYPLVEPQAVQAGIALQSSSTVSPAEAQKPQSGDDPIPT